jgi:DNA-binding CsgD family transcriptional regulator
MSFENRKKYIQLLLVLCALTTTFFSSLPLLFKFLSLAILGYTTGRVTVFCTYKIGSRIHGENIIKYIATILFLGYFALYISNMFLPFIQPFMASCIISVLILVLLYFYTITFKDTLVCNKTKATFKKKEVPLSLFLVVFMIFITAGITYAGIYPDFQKYASIERYYNVLPFLITLFFANYLGKKFGFQIFLYLGLCFLGLSFFYNMLATSATTYFLIQTSLQIGWAFMDTFVWVLGARLAARYRSPHYLPYFIATFLAGTFAGSLLIAFTKDFFIEHYGLISNVLTHLPILFAIVFLGKVSVFLNDLESTPVSNGSVDEIPEIFNHQIFNTLTSRELDIVVLLSKNTANSSISEQLYISPNTLKTHSRNIYRKLDIKNKIELIKFVKSLETE